MDWIIFPYTLVVQLYTLDLVNVPCENFIEALIHCNHLGVTEYFLEDVEILF